MKKHLHIKIHRMQASLSRRKPNGKAILGVQRGWTSSTRHYCRLMYVQSRPRWLWDLASPGEARRSVPRGPSAVGPSPIGEIATSRAREVFSTDLVAKPRATIRVSFSALFPNNSEECFIRESFDPWISESRRQGFKIARATRSGPRNDPGKVWKSDRPLAGVYVWYSAAATMDLLSERVKFQVLR